LDGGRGCVFQTDDVGQGGMSKKSVFARNCLMDDPLDEQNEADMIRARYRIFNKGGEGVLKYIKI